jgi:hypothetical protein
MGARPFVLLFQRAVCQSSALLQFCVVCVHPYALFLPLISSPQPREEERRRMYVCDATQPKRKKEEKLQGNKTLRALSHIYSAGRIFLFCLLINKILLAVRGSLLLLTQILFISFVQSTAQVPIDFHQRVRR